MKNLITLSLFLVSILGRPSQSNAQYPTSAYSFQALSGSYTPVTGGTTTGTTSTILSDDGIQTNIPIGFVFTFSGINYTQLSADANGYISLANSTAQEFGNSTGDILSAGWLMPYWDDLHYASTGTSSYIVTGSAPFRVFTLEWSNWGFCCAPTPNILSFEIKLFETTNVIQFAYSPNGSYASSATIGIANSSTDYKVLNNASTTPTASSSTFTTSIATQPASGQIYQFTPPVILPCTPPTAQASNMVLASSASIVNGSFTAASPAASGYLVVRSNGPLAGAPVNGVTYTVGSLLGANGTIISASSGLSFSDQGLTPSTSYTYTVFSYTSGILCSIVYDTSDPLVNSINTGGINIYTWNKTVSANYQTATNWTPTRTVPDPTDILVFDNGISDTATNVPSSANAQGIGRLSIANNTQAHFRSSTAASLTININGVPGTTGLDIGNGSGLILDGTSALTLKFGAGTLPNISGNLEVSSTSGLNAIDFTNVAMTIAPTGQLAAGGTLATSPFLNLNAPSSLVINGTYNLKYTTTGGYVPAVATWGPSSNFLISGYTTSTAGPVSGLNQVFPNITYNASNQTSVCNWAGNPLNVTGTLNISSTGTGSWALVGTQAYTSTVNNFVQQGGTVDLSTGINALQNTQVLAVGNTFNQLGGSITSSGTGTTQPVLYFNGTNGQQSVTLSNPPTGPIVYRVGNAAGISLVGINRLGSTPILSINSGGGVRISTTNANPINTTMLLQYASQNSTLTYDTSGTIVATSSVWPSLTPPFNVVVNVGTGNTVKVPFNASIPGALQFLSGDLDMSTFNLTIGSSIQSPNQGSILEPMIGSPYLNVQGNGNVRVTTGSLTRYFGIANLPTTPGNPPASTTGQTSAGFFPIAFGASDRNVFIYFNGVSALGSGGTITITHNPATGTSPLTPAIVDGAYAINLRTNASWTVTTSSFLALNPTATMGIQATAGNLISPINVNQLRLTHLTNIPGVNTGGGGGAPDFTAGRSGLQVSDLTNGPWYFDANTADLNANGVYTQITTGNWTTPGVWDIGSVPGGNNLAVINPGVVSTISGANCAARSLTVLGTINDNASGNTLNVDSQLVNNGSMNVNGGGLMVNTNGTANAVSMASFVGIYNFGNFSMNGGTVVIGPPGGGNKPFQNYGGFTMLSGALNINGSFGSLPGSYFTQSGGNITVDGNAGGVAVNSVPHGRALFSLATGAVNLWGGNITIVDPGADTTNLNSTSGFQAAFEYAAPVGTPVYNDSSMHTITLGDGISTDPGGSAHGFFIDPVGPVISALFNFSNLIINGAPGVNRAVTTYYSAVGVQNQMTINNGGEYRTSNHDLVINGNITVNTGGKLTTDDVGTLTFGHLTFTSFPTAVAAAPPLSAQPQTLSGTGIFVNANNNTANLGNIKTMSAPYVVFNTGTTLTFPSTDAVNFTPVNGVPSRIIMATGSLAETGASATSNNASAANGWVVGSYEKFAAVGNITGNNFTYPIGDSTRFTPVRLSSGTANVLSAGTISVATKPTVSSVLSFSTLNPLKILNRTYTIATSGTLSILPAGTSATFSWVPSDVSATANYQNFVAGVNTSGTTWAYPTVTGASATSITVDTILSGTYQIAESCPPTVITQQPVRPGGCINGVPIVLTVVATGASLQYQWYHSQIINGVAVTIAIPNANGPTYTKSVPNIGDTGTYFVVITGACSAADTSNKVPLILGTPPAIVTQPVSQGVCAGYPFTLCINSPGATTFRWQLNGIDIPGTLIQNAPCLTVSSADLLNVGSIICIFGNGCANDTSLAAVVTLLPLPAAAISTTTPLAFCEGGYVDLSANYAPGYSFQWQVDGRPIPGAINEVFPATGTGNYAVTVTDVNSCSSLSSSDSVIVFPAPALPVVSSQSSNTFCAGGSVQLVETPDPSLNYQWQLNNSDIPGATFPNYTATGSGNYSVTVRNIQGCSSTSPATLVTSLTIPAGNITTSGSTSLCTGSSVVLAAPSGQGYAYQWYNSGVPINIGGTNSSYTANAAGAYNAVISNGYCADTTAFVTVTINSLPANTISVSGPTTFCEGGHTVLTAGTGPATSYQWLKNGNNTVNISASDTVTTTGQYSVIIRNAAGCAETTVPVSITVDPLPSPGINDIGTSDTLTTQTSYLTYQWFEGGAPVTMNGTSATYVAPSSGSYTVYVTDGQGCSNMSPSFFYTALGVQNVNAAHVRIYPNPARDIVYIDAPVDVNVSITSIDGKQLFNRSEVKSINISELPNGVYMIRINGADGNLIMVDKLVKSAN